MWVEIHVFFLPLLLESLLFFSLSPFPFFIIFWLFNDNSEKVFICSLLLPHLPLSHSSSRERSGSHCFGGMVIYLIVVVMTKPILRESKAEYQRIVLVCEAQSDWNSAAQIGLRFLPQHAACGCRWSLCWWDALHLWPLGWSSQREVNLMIKTMTESAVSVNCVWARLNSRFFVFQWKEWMYC